MWGFNRLLACVFQWGLRIIGPTIRFTLHNEDAIQLGAVTGYWHGDSCSMLLLLQSLREKGLSPLGAAVTADWRGDIIAEVMESFGASAMRLQDGAGIRRMITELRRHLAHTNDVFAISLDGPLGPRYQPKRFLFRLAQQNGRPVVAVRFHYSNVVRLTHRWDHYALPLPFSRIDVFVHDIGHIAPNMLADFDDLCSCLRLSDEGVT